MRSWIDPGKQYLSMNAAELTKHRNIAVAWLRENFPDKSHGMTHRDLNVMMHNLCTYVPAFQRRPFKIHNLTLGDFRREGISLHFEDRPCLLLNQPAYYNTMNLLPEYFMDLERMRVRRQDARLSPLDDYRTNTARFVDLCLRKHLRLDVHSLRETIYESLYEATEFKPSVLAALLHRFGLDCHANVLDFCAGRGSRLVACMARGVGYVGVDPDVALHPIYTQMIRALAKDPSRYEMLCAKAQDLDLEKLSKSCPKQFDMVMTSPPYGILEHYSDEASQSDVEFPTQDRWLAGFLIPSIARAARYLRVGGHMIININDPGRSVEGRWEYTLSMLVTIRDSRDPELHSLRYLGMIGYAEPGKPAQPMWVWVKEGKAPEPISKP